MSTGVHVPLAAKILTFAGRQETRLALVTLDLGWWMDDGDEQRFREVVGRSSGLSESGLVVALTHTHAGPSLSRADRDRPGGHLIGPYLDGVADAVAAEVRAAFAESEDCTLEWIQGSCGLAVNRDLRLDNGTFVVGSNEAAPADDALLVGRLTNSEGRIRAVIANYAIHLTSLGPENSLISPDLIGASRELVEQAVGAPFVFLPGAAGDLAPLIQYGADTAAADRNGRALGYAVLAELERMPPPGSMGQLTAVLPSGAPLGLVEFAPAEHVSTLGASTLTVSLPIQPNRPPAHADDEIQRERLLRAERIRANAEGAIAEFPVTTWVLGDAVLFAYPGEAYSDLQMNLRAEFADFPIIFVNLANGGHLGYIASDAAHDSGRYPAWQSPIGRGALDLLTQRCRQFLAGHVPHLVAPGSRPLNQQIGD